jgi:hypothetical protein
VEAEDAAVPLPAAAPARRNEIFIIQVQNTIIYSLSTGVFLSVETW